MYNLQPLISVVLQACEENICDNGGTCSKHVNDYRCECPPGFSGFLCEEGMAYQSVSFHSIYTVFLKEVKGKHVSIMS